jgi:hypothetical protein
MVQLIFLTPESYGRAHPVVIAPFAVGLTIYLYGVAQFWRFPRSKRQSK